MMRQLLDSIFATRRRGAPHGRAAALGSGISAALLFATSASALPLTAQSYAEWEPTLASIWEEGQERSQLERTGRYLIDVIGPRITGTPGLEAAHLWLEEEYRALGIEVEQQRYGSWEGWSAGLSHLDLLEPRRTSLRARTLAWSPGTEGPVEGRVIALPRTSTPSDFRAWMESEVEGAFVLISFPQPTCRPDPYWEYFGTPRTNAAMQRDRDERLRDWTARIDASGTTLGGLPRLLEDAGAAGILTLNWTGGWGTNRVFDTGALLVPTVDLECEDYGLLARLVESGVEPRIRLDVEAEFTGTVPTFNTIARIPGRELPNEYVVLSAHLDSWGGAGGATDNGTGTIVMLEAMRILKAVYPNPRRTILVGHWGGEEQGLNGSAAFAEDNPEVVEGIQILLNQDNGTGRIAEIGMQGFSEAGPFFERWLARIPAELGREVVIDAPGVPDGGRSDHASFVCHGAPAFRLGSVEWDYREYTWHTTRDTFDKVAIEEVRGNAILTAMLTYLASEEGGRVPRTTRNFNPDGTPLTWPQCRTPQRAM